MSSAESIYTPRHEVLASGYQFVEAPRVDDSGAVYFSDLLAGGFYRRTTDGEIRHFIADRKWIGGIVLNADGTVICSGRGGIVRLDVETGRLQPVLSELGGEAIDAVNDIEADANGALYGGTIDFTSILGRGSDAPARCLLSHRPGWRRTRHSRRCGRVERHCIQSRWPPALSRGVDARRLGL